MAPHEPLGLSSELLTKLATQAPTLETFAHTLVERALLAAAQKNASTNLDSKAVKLDCVVTLTYNPSARGEPCWWVCVENLHGARFCHKVCRSQLE